MFIFAVGAVSGFGVISMPDDIDSRSRSASLDIKNEQVEDIKNRLISLENKLDNYIKNISIQIDENFLRLLEEIRGLPTDPETLVEKAKSDVGYYSIINKMRDYWDSDYVYQDYDYHDYYDYDYVS